MTSIPPRAYLIPGHEDLLRDIKLEEFCVHAVHHGRDNIVHRGRDFLDEIGIARGEIKEVGEVRDAVVERRLDEKGIDFLREDGALRVRIVLGMGRGGMEGRLRVLGLGRGMRAGTLAGERTRVAAGEGAHERFALQVELQGSKRRFHDGSEEGVVGEESRCSAGERGRIMLARRIPGNLCEASSVSVGRKRQGQIVVEEWQRAAVGRDRRSDRPGERESGPGVGSKQDICHLHVGDTCFIRPCSPPGRNILCAFPAGLPSAARWRYQPDSCSTLGRIDR